jgi:hypothetical protein
LGAVEQVIDIVFVRRGTVTEITFSSEL